MAKILLIEDDQLLGNLYFEMLKQQNYEVELVTNGKTAYERLTQENWDLVLLDSLLPEMNGIEILEKLKVEHPEKLKQKFMIITNLDDGNMLGEIRKFNYVIIIKSQLDPDQFLEKVKNSLI